MSSAADLICRSFASSLSGKFSLLRNDTRVFRRSSDASAIYFGLAYCTHLTAEQVLFSTILSPDLGARHSPL